MSAPTQPQALWVRMQGWVLVEAELPEPVTDSVLEGTGLRVRGSVERGDPGAEEAIARSHKATDADSQTVEYVVTGQVLEANDFDSDQGSGSRHSGTDVVITVNGSLIQAQLEGWARDFSLGSRLSVRGELLVIPYYEWGDFGLVDTRSTWSVEEARRLPEGDLLLRMLPVPTSL